MLGATMFWVTVSCHWIGGAAPRRFVAGEGVGGSSVIAAVWPLG